MSISCDNDDHDDGGMFWRRIEGNMLLHTIRNGTGFDEDDL